MRVTKGRELEGRLAGVLTLFVSGDVDVDVLAELINEYRPGAVYFGAHGTEVSPDGWPAVRRFLGSRGLVVTVDTEDPGLVPCDVRREAVLMLRTRHVGVDLLKPGDMVKVEGELSVLAAERRCFAATSWSAYVLEDEEVWPR